MSISTRKNTLRVAVMTALIAGSLLLIGEPALAANAPPLIVPIPSGAGELTTIPGNPADYVKTIYQWSIGIAALLAMGQLVVGGIQYILAAGNVSSKESANERMKSAISGLIILLAIVVILTTINPKLANIKLPEINNNLRLEGVLDNSDATLDSLSANVQVTYRANAEKAVADRAAGAGNNATTQAEARKNPTYRAEDELNNQGGREYCPDDLQDIKAEVDEFLTDPDMAELIGPDGFFNGDNGDFAEVLAEEYQAQQDLKAAAVDDKPQYQATIRCKRSVVVLGIGYVREQFNSAQLRQFTAAFRGLPAQYKPDMYLSSPEKVFEGL